ncbi:MAG: hypothetical protein PVJ49_18600, partial [Acidobacteriota bacterium]
MSSDAAAVTATDDLSIARLTARQIGGLVGYTVRESLHRWTLVAYLLAITFFLLLLATAVNLDIVEGTLASARLFGQDLQIGNRAINVEELVRFFQVGVVVLLYGIGVVLALFLTSSYVPSLVREGWVDLLIAQPISRPVLLLGRVLGAITVVSIGVAYLIGGTWLILRYKTGFGSMSFLGAGVVILLAYTFNYTAAVAVGIVTRNAPVSGMVALMTLLGGHLMSLPHRYPDWRVALRAGWPRQTATAITEGLYLLLPRNQDLAERAIDAARGEPVALAPIWSSLPFAALCLFIACWWFSR